MSAHKHKLPEVIYIQLYGEDGEYLDPVEDEVTWCRDKINDTDVEYVLAKEAATDLANLLDTNKFNSEMVATLIERNAQLRARIADLEANIIEADSMSNINQAKRDTAEAELFLVRMASMGAQAITDVRSLHTALDKARKVIIDSRDLARTGLPCGGYTEDEWAMHRLNRIAGDLTAWLKEFGG